VEKILSLGGRGALEPYNKSLSSLLKAVYPEKEWDLSRFEKMRNGFWSSVERQREFMDKIGKELGIEMERESGGGGGERGGEEEGGSGRESKVPFSYVLPLLRPLLLIFLSFLIFFLFHPFSMSRFPFSHPSFSPHLIFVGQRV